MQKLITISKYPLKYNYYVSDMGKIYSEVSHKILCTRLDKDGYEKVGLVSKDNKRHMYSVHRLVLENFNPVENMNNLQVNHIDGNKQNNCLDNLEWVTCQENIRHACLNNLRHNQKGGNNNASKLTEDNVKEIINLLLEHKLTQKEIGQIYGVKEDCIGAIKQHKNWKFLTDGIEF